MDPQILKVLGSCQWKCIGFRLSSFLYRMGLTFLWFCLPTTSYAQPYFSKAIDLNNHGRERIKKFVIIDSLLYASTGQRCGDSDCTSIVKMNLGGNVIDHRLFPWLDGGDQEYIVADDGMIAVSGHRGWHGESGYYIQVVNNHLDSLHTGIFTTTDSVTVMANKSLISYNDSYLITGFTRPLDDVNWPSDLFWLNADLTVDTIIRLRLGDQATSLNEGKVDENGLLNVLFQYDSSADIGFHRGIIRFNAEKEIVSIWETPFQNTTTIVENMVFLKNGNIVIMEQDDVNDYELMFQTYEGEHLFSSVLESTGYDSKTPFELKVALNGDIIGCGVYQSTQIDTFECCIYTGYIFRMSPDGELLWERIIIDYDSTGQYKDGTFTDIHELPNGDLILGGDIEALRLPEHDLDMWLVRTDSMGCLTPGCGEIQVVTGTREVRYTDSHWPLRVFPNPASDILTIELEETLIDGRFVFEIFDIHGVLIRSRNSLSGSEEIDIQALAPGMYFMSISNEKGGQWIQKFIKTK